MSADAERLPEEASEEAVPESQDCEADVNKDQGDVDQEGVTDEDVEEVSEEVREEAMETVETGSDEEETETELTIAAVKSTTDQPEEVLETEKEQNETLEELHKVGNSEENEAMEVEQADAEEEEVEEEEETEAPKSSSPKKVHFSDQVSCNEKLLSKIIYVLKFIEEMEP